MKQGEFVAESLEHTGMGCHMTKENQGCEQNLSCRLVASKKYYPR